MNQVKYRIPTYAELRLAAKKLPEWVGDGIKLSDLAGKVRKEFPDPELGNPNLIIHMLNQQGKIRADWTTWRKNYQNSDPGTLNYGELMIYLPTEK